MSVEQTPKQIRLDERNHVEKPLLEQLAGLGWEVIDLTDMKQTPGRHPSGELHRSLDDAGAARAAQGHQPLARRRPGRGGRQAAHRELPEHRFAGEQQVTCSSSCWRTPASARTVKVARRARPSASWTLRRATTTASSQYASSRSASSAPSTTSSPTSCCSSTACQWW